MTIQPTTHPSINPLSSATRNPDTVNVVSNPDNAEETPRVIFDNTVEDLGISDWIFPAKEVNYKDSPAFALEWAFFLKTFHCICD